MKKKFFILFLFFLFLSLIYLLINQNQLFTKKNIVKSPIGNSKKTIVNQNKKKDPPLVTRLPTKENFSSAKNLDSFNRKKISWLKENMYLVEGLTARHKKDSQSEPLAFHSGFYFYESGAVEGSEVIFNAEKNKYGIYTQEIIFKGNTNSILNFIKSMSWEILYQNELLGSIIAKVEKVEDASVLQELKVQNDFQWKLGVIYTLPSRK